MTEHPSRPSPARRAAFARIRYWLRLVPMALLVCAWAAPATAGSIPAPVTINFDGLGFGDNLDYGSKVFTSGDFTITSSNVNWSTLNATSGQCQGGSSGCVYIADGPGYTETVTIQTTSGNEFNFVSFWDSNFGAGFITKVEGYRGATLVATQSSGFPNSGMTTITLGSSFQDVNRVVISSNSMLGFNDIFDSFAFGTAVYSPPGAPTGATATAGNAQATVTFTAPASAGSTAIASYTATASPGGATGTCAGPSACPITVAGLTNGTAYAFTVTASNSIGTGSASSVSNSVTPKGTQTITFNNPGVQNFGTTPTLSASATSALLPTFTSATTGVCTITSGGALAFVTVGTCTINADQAGNAAYSAASQVSQSFSVIAVVPGAPTIGTASAGNTQANVAFSAPASSGGASISGYTVTASPGGATGTGISSPIAVTGLTNGVAYTFTATATNSAGTGSASSASNSVTPKAPQTITFVNPGAKNFGTSPTLTATATSGLTPSFTSNSTGVCTITSGGALTFVAAGTCTINADQAGNGAYLAAPQVSQSFSVAAVAPGAPVIGTATAGDTQVNVAFGAPAFGGGASISAYTVTANPGGATGTGGASPIAVTGLSNGVAYTFTVTATNSAGTGSASAASNSATPAAAQTITFANPGAQNFGTAPTLTATATSGLTPSFTSSTGSVCTITGGGTLTFVTTGTCTVNANQAGNSSYLAAPTVSRSFAVNGVTPGAPTIGTATAGDTQATVSFSAPASSGGSSITAYTVTANPGGATATGAASPLTVTGLSNGTAYTFSVTATNSAGTGGASSSSNSITPKAGQTIAFAQPATQNFGTAPTLTATASSGLSVTFTTGTAAVCTITGGGTLAFVAGGTCTINADQGGNNAWLAAATATRSFAVAAVAPAAPTIGLATAGNTQASVAFTAPVNVGGSAITSYTVTSTPGGFTATGVASPITVGGLVNGTSYTFSVKATNAAGSGASSAASNSAVPATIPGAPTIGVATAGNSQATVAFAAPATTGGSAITSYTVTSTPGGFTATGAASPIAVGGLTNGVSYTFKVTASSAAGTGIASAASNAVTPAGVPGAPTAVSATADNALATIHFTAPAANGGAAVAAYTATSSPGGLTGTCSGPAACVITVSGLAGATAYTFTVTATNAAGTGTASTASNAVTLAGVPTPSGANLQTQMNAPAVLDLAPYLAGSAITGVNIVVPAKHGATAVAGTSVTYTPAANFFGADTFSYVTVTATGSSAPAVVTVNIGGRPDPSKDPGVAGLVTMQAQTARNFWRAQISNVQQHMESRHRATADVEACDGHSIGAASVIPQPGGVSSADGMAPPAGRSPPAGAGSDDSALPRSGLLRTRPGRPGQPSDPNQSSPDSAPGGVNPSAWLGSLASVLNSSSISFNLASLSSALSPAGEPAAGPEVWGAGDVRVGSRSPQGGLDKVDYRTDGVSLGVDRRFGDHWMFGMGAGYASDKSTAGTGGIDGSSAGTSVFGYAGYQAGPLYVDTLLGYGRMDVDAGRYVAAVADYARSDRSAKQLFASVAVGWELRAARALLAPYVRYDQAVDKFGDATESGAGNAALSYASQAFHSQQLSLGVRGEYRQDTPLGWLTPRVRVEYQHRVEGDSQTSLAYADALGARYVLDLPAVRANALRLGLGGTLALRNGVKVDLGYDLQRSGGQDNSQTILLQVSMELGAKRP